MKLGQMTRVTLPAKIGRLNGARSSMLRRSASLAGSLAELRTLLKAPRDELLVKTFRLDKFNVFRKVFFGKCHKQRPVARSSDEHNVVTLAHRLGEACYSKPQLNFFLPGSSLSPSQINQRDSRPRPQAIERGDKLKGHRRLPTNVQIATLWPHISKERLQRTSFSLNSNTSPTLAVNTHCRSDDEQDHDCTSHWPLELPRAQHAA